MAGFFLKIIWPELLGLDEAVQWWRRSNKLPGDETGRIFWLRSTYAKQSKRITNINQAYFYWVIHLKTNSTKKSPLTYWTTEFRGGLGRLSNIPPYGKDFLTLNFSSPGRSSNTTTRPSQGILIHPMSELFIFTCHCLQAVKASFEVGNLRNVATPYEIQATNRIQLEIISILYLLKYFDMKDSRVYSTVTWSR